MMVSHGLLSTLAVAGASAQSIDAVLMKIRGVTETFTQALEKIQASQEADSEGQRHLQPGPGSSWTCLPVEGGNYFNCFGARPDYMENTLPDSAVILLYCDIDLTFRLYEDARVRNHCIDVPAVPASGLCSIRDQLSGHICSSCTVLQNGEIAYNCENVYDSSPCSSRNELGECGDYEGWVSVWNPWGNGRGFLCVLYNQTIDDYFSAGDLLPKLSAEISNDLTPVLWCEQRVTGRSTLSQCGYDFCRLTSTSRAAECWGCKLLLDKAVYTERTLSTGENIFAYHCADLYPEAPCIATDVDGNCIQQTLAYDAFRDRCEYLPDISSVEDKDESGWIGVDWKSWVLLRIEPRTFNILSSLTALVTRAFVGFGMEIAYPMLISWHLQRPKKRIVPLGALDGTGADLSSTAQLVHAAKGALPTVFLFLALTIAEFSHPIADTGFDFIQNKEEGPTEPVLSLRTENRNSDRLMETMGDPVGVRTQVRLEVDGLDPNRTIPFYPQMNISPEADAFVQATSLIAQGSSSFTTSFYGSKIFHQNFLGVDDFSVQVGIPCEAPDETVPLPLAEIPLEIPVSCAPGQSTMVPLPQIIWDRFVEPLRHTAYVPNCTLTETRSSGIFQKPPSAQILEHARRVTAPDLNDTSASSLVNLIVDGSPTPIFQATPEDKKLARDRPDWKQGRRVSGVEGAQIGNETIAFSTVILATGGEIFDGFAFQNVEQLRSHRLFATLTDGCPDRPSGYPLTAEMVCFASVELDCPAFDEDNNVPDDVFFVSGEATECNVMAIQFVWGSNFDMDDELLATIAGAYGMVRFSDLENTRDYFDIHGALAGLFALGSLDNSTSVETVVRAEINIVYVISMLVPIALAPACFLIALMLRHKKLTIPGTTWEFLVFGRENPDLPTRRSKRDKFPAPRDLYLQYGPIRPGSSTKALIITGKTINAALQNNAENEVPVAPEEVEEGPVGDTTHSSSDTEMVVAPEEEQEGSVGVSSRSSSEYDYDC